MDRNFRPYNPATQEKQTTSTNNSSELRLAKLALFGNLISIIGQAISTYVQILAIQDLEEQQFNDPYEAKIQKLEREIQELRKEIEKQKRRYPYL